MHVAVFGWADDLVVALSREEQSRRMRELGLPAQRGQCDGGDAASLDRARDQSDRLVAGWSDWDENGRVSPLADGDIGQRGREIVQQGAPVGLVAHKADVLRR